MKTFKYPFLCLACGLILSAQPCLAQEEEGEYQEAYTDGIEIQKELWAGMPKLRLMPELKANRVELPRTERPTEHGGFDGDVAQFQPAGYAAPAPPDLMRRIRWQQQQDGSHIGAIELRSQDATALRIQFTGDFGRNGEELRVYDPKEGYTFGPYSLPRMNEDGTWWTTIIFGEHIGLEFYVPPGVASTGLPELTGIGYMYAGGPSDFHPAGCSHRDVACEAAWRDSEARAVTMLSTLSGSNVFGFCSGALINRSPSDLAPVVMTANHCIGTQGAANNTTFVWNFQNATCNGTPPAANSLPRSVGAILLKRHSSSDWNLLGSYEQPGAGFYLGWDSSDSYSNGSAANGIHHPGGTFKRISFGTKTGSRNQTFCDSNGQNCFNADVWDVDYTTGFTQPGSSGSPLMDGSRRVRGTLTGGPSNDCSVSRYGRFHNAFGTIRYFLFEMANPTYVNRAVAGDGANNAGASERGTSGNPFNSVYEATFCVPRGNNVQIVPGNYNERFTIWRAMTLRREGSSGIVRIGSN